MAEEKETSQDNQSTDQVLTSEFRGPVCGRAFDNRQELLDHERTHMGEEVGKTETSDAAAAKNAGNLSDRGNQTVPWGEERAGWTTGTGDREEGEMTGRETPGGRNSGFSSE